MKESTRRGLVKQKDDRWTSRLTSSDAYETLNEIYENKNQKFYKT